MRRRMDRRVYALSVEAKKRRAPHMRVPSRRLFAMMATPAAVGKVHIDIVSDTVCPWCWVGAFLHHLSFLPVLRRAWL